MLCGNEYIVYRIIDNALLLLSIVLLDKLKKLGNILRSFVTCHR